MSIPLIPDTGHQPASTLKQNAIAMLDKAQLLRRALQSLEMSWQGGAQTFDNTSCRRQAYDLSPAARKQMDIFMKKRLAIGQPLSAQLIP